MYTICGHKTSRQSLKYIAHINSMALSIQINPNMLIWILDTGHDPFSAYVSQHLSIRTIL